MTLTDIIYTGANTVAKLTENSVQSAIEHYGDGAAVAFPDTAYGLPVIYAATGIKITRLEELIEAVKIQKSLISGKDDLGEALNAGLATAVGAEILEALKYINGNPYADQTGIGHIPDSIIRSLGVPLVTGDIPGIAVLIGQCEPPQDVVQLVKDYQSRGIMTFLVGHVIDQIAASDVKMGLEYRVIPLGYEITSVIHVVSVAIRAALIFGAIEPGNLKALLTYTKDRVPAFVNTFGSLDEITVSAGAGAIALGFPVLADTEVPEVPDALISVKNHQDLLQTSLDTRGIKIKVTNIDSPVQVSSAFEGERIRKDAMKVEFGGNRTKCWELVVTEDLKNIEDHKIEVIGKDVDDTSFENQSVVRLPLGIKVSVAGKHMQEDFESVLERRIHYFINYIEGVMHVGQRNISWIRISKDSYDKGFRLKHFGEVLYAKMHDEFGTIVDKCAVTIYTEEEDVAKYEEELAKPVYKRRDERLDAMTDESVGQFYTCNLCQSFAPAHVCVVTPERLGLCGAVSWLDSKATYELDPTGPSQPINKEKQIDAKTGAWEEVNETVAAMSGGAVDHVTLYSILENPMTSCGCFECICGIMPEANGVVIVNREFGGMTPVGMTFGELASMTGGGVQTPGFMGHGRHFIGSKKFMAAEGGVERIVWMPKELKDDMAERLNKAAKELYGIDNFSDMVCDETIATESEAVLEYLTEKGHPALGMDAIM